LTTAVLGLNRHDLNITCIRLRPYKMDNQILIESTQIIPLPESADYEVKIREQERVKRKAANPNSAIQSRFWETLIHRAKEKTNLLGSYSITSHRNLNISAGVAGIRYTLRFLNTDVRVICFVDLKIDSERTTRWFDKLHQRREEIEKTFGDSLDWLALTSKQERRIRKIMPGSSQSPESEWPQIQDRMIDALIRLDDALRQPIQELKI
jgi:hypothetical protein